MKKVLDSGSTLEITRSPFALSHRLFKATMKELGHVDLNFGVQGKSVKDVFKMDVNDQVINTIKNTLAKLLCSEEIEAILWLCFERALYNDQKITKDIFENETAAGDFLEISKEVMVYNLIPFSKGLQSLFQGLPINKVSDTQKS